MLRLTKLGHHPHAIGNRFCHKLANCPLTLSDSIHTILDKMILIEHDLILFLSWFMELTSCCAVGAHSDEKWYAASGSSAPAKVYARHGHELKGCKSVRRETGKE